MKTPRNGTARLALALLLTIAATSLCAAKTFVYVSNAQDGNIDAFAMDATTGALTPIGKAEAAKLVMPMAVSPDKKHLYAVVRSQPLRVLTYAIEPNGALTQKASAPLPDSMPYVSTDHTGHWLFTASYGGDKLAVSPIGANGLVEADAIQVIPTGRNAHSILPDRSNKFVYAATLGANQVLQFNFDSKAGLLTPNDPPAVSPAPGHGPRHMAFSPDDKYLYVINELSGHVTQYAIDRSGSGTLSLVDTISSVSAEAGLEWGKPQAPVGATPAPAAAPPKDEKPKVWAADIGITPNGKFLYTTERTTNKIALFTVASGSGKLTYVGNFATEAQPRGIRIDPSGRYLVASGEKSDRLSVYKIDQDTGKLGEPGRYPAGAGANWVEIVDVE
jgi:6-phosphogluconolactonase